MSKMRRAQALAELPQLEGQPRLVARRVRAVPLAAACRQRAEADRLQTATALSALRHKTVPTKRSRLSRRAQKWMRGVTRNAIWHCPMAFLMARLSRILDLAIDSKDDDLASHCRRVIQREVARSARAMARIAAGGAP